MNKYAALYQQSLKTAYRDLTKEEESQFEDETNRVLPRLFKSDADPASYSASNPTMHGIAGGVGGALLGGGLGAAAGSLLGGTRVENLVGSSIRPSGTGAAVGGILGSAAGATIMALIANKLSKVHNTNLKETMKRSRPGATQADIAMDPLTQHRQNLLFQAAQASALASMASRR